jgi:hypothetical protein
MLRLWSLLRDRRTLVRHRLPNPAREKNDRRTPPARFDSFGEGTARCRSGVGSHERLSSRHPTENGGTSAHWLEQVGGGDDFRTNEEVAARFFRPDGTLDPAATRALAKDIATLLVPSAERAVALDRAYLALVRAQRFERGRDVVLRVTPTRRAW